jgi:hypothetical protein
VHGLDYAKVVDSVMGHLALEQISGDDADDFTACIVDGIGDRTHESDSRAAKDEADSCTNQRLT